MSAFWPGDRVKVRRRGSAPIHVAKDQHEGTVLDPPLDKNDYVRVRYDTNSGLYLHLASELELIPRFKVGDRVYQDERPGVYGTVIDDPLGLTGPDQIYVQWNIPNTYARGRYDARTLELLPPFKPCPPKFTGPPKPFEVGARVRVIGDNWTGAICRVVRVSPIPIAPLHYLTTVKNVKSLTDCEAAFFETELELAPEPEPRYKVGDRVISQRLFGRDGAFPGVIRKAPRWADYESVWVYGLNLDCRTDNAPCVDMAEQFVDLEPPNVGARIQVPNKVAKELDFAPGKATTGTVIEICDGSWPYRVRFDGYSDGDHAAIGLLKRDEFELLPTGWTPELMEASDNVIRTVIRNLNRNGYRVLKFRPGGGDITYTAGQPPSDAQGREVVTGVVLEELKP